MITAVSFFAALLLLIGLIYLWQPADARTKGVLRVRLSDLWRWDGAVDRGPYVLIGATGFAVKHNLDRVIASFVFHRPWGLFNYWIPPTKAMHITLLPEQDAKFLATMLVVALPFVWVGVVLTLRRLRGAGLPVWLVGAFFLPVLNLAFFLILSLIPSQGDRAIETQQPQGWRDFLDKVIPEHAIGSAAMAQLLTVPVALAAVAVGASGLGVYGWGLFVALPFWVGLASVLLYGHRRPRSFGGCMLVSALSMVLLGAALIALAFEGVICLAMAFPIGLTLACIGGSIGYIIQNRPWAKAQAPSMMLVLLLMAPAFMGAEYVSAERPPALEVRTAIDIQASPNEVWRRLISFPRLPEPQDWLFRLGVAYPMQASIQGQGVGAVRECLFSTGTFVERIDAWEENKRLQFSITSQPLVMRELSPYREIHPRHLDGYLQPQQAEFVLMPLPGGGTRLEGVSRYSNNMWPAGYWQLWSDQIVHRVHRRVFEHIKRLAEAAPSN
ncbi:MAG TPA: hypothetical protein VEU62_18900 [Bryobacterales bacterium]|nr:hypothetical protein [Bryobacterales bacterium]